MHPTPSAFASSSNTVFDIYRLIDAMRADSADLRDSIRLSRISIRESHAAIRHADEVAAASPGEPVERKGWEGVKG